MTSALGQTFCRCANARLAFGPRGFGAASVLTAIARHKDSQMQYRCC